MRYAATFLLTVMLFTVIVLGIIYPTFGGIVVGLMFFCAVWAIADLSFGHHFE